MKPFRISRRALLAGLGGTSVALPLLEIFGEHQALAATAPLRYLVMFGGMSGGRDGVAGNILEPAATGAGYQPTVALAPLVARGVKDRVGIVSGMKIPRDPSKPGGSAFEWHATTMGPLLSGSKFAPIAGGRSPIPTGVTSDQVVADAIGASSSIRSLNYRVQAETYRSTSSERGVMSWRKAGTGLQRQDPTVSATLAYQALTSKIRASDPAAQKRAEAEAVRHKSAISMVQTKTALAQRLGGEDRKRLERHFDELRSFETSLSNLNASVAGCMAPSNAPADSTVIQDAYAHEKERAPMLADLIKLAFACDITRVATLCVTHAQSFLGTKSLIPSGVSTECHQTSHSGNLLQANREVMTWHVDVFAYMVSVLKNTTDIDGRSLLDNTAVVYLFEGGAGADPQEGSARSSHCSDNMAALVAGRAAGRAAGQHVRATNLHPASVLLTAMKNTGVAASALGEISTTVPEILI
jgi:hypothetical protein